MLIQLDHVKRQFKDFIAVDDVSFSAGHGEIIGLLGHNGAGKTTIIKMLTGFLEPTQGTIVIDGLNMETHLRAIQSRIGYLPENCPLWPDMTIVEFLLYQGSLKGIEANEVEDHVYHVMQKADLLEKASQTISTLSKGYRQRVGVANAILNQPKLIILDEPTNGLDPSQTLNMRALIKELSKHSTVILSTHILQEVQAMCDRVIVIRRGQLVIDSTLSALDKINGLRLCVDQNEEKIHTLLNDFADISAIQLTHHNDNQFHYLLDVDSTKASSISKAILDAGYQLYEVTPERQNLESLLKEEFQRDIN